MTSPEYEEVHLPDFLCIGAQKAGTSWLDANLRDHPDIWMPPIKELHFFDHLFVSRFRRWTENHIHQKVTAAINNHESGSNPRDSQFLRYLNEMRSGELFTEVWYRRIFSRPEAITKTVGEVTPAYSTIPREGIQYLKDFLGSPRIIYIIRHPVSRAASQIRMNLLKAYGANATVESRMLTKGDWLLQVTNWDVQHRGRYSKYVPAWCEQFDDDHLLFLPYSRIGQEPDTVLTEIESFLGLSSYGKYPKATRRVHGGQKNELPDFVLDAIKESTSHEVMFLESHFGKRFTKMT